MTAYRHGPKRVIGLVGAIGGGKSTVAAAFAARGGLAVNADAIGHAVLAAPGVVSRVLERWGHVPNIRRADGSIDRRTLAAVVFADPAERSALEELVFPEIRRRVEDEVARGMSDPAVRFVVLDAAVMMEAGWNDACDSIVYVDAPRNLRLSRLAARSGWTADDLDAREAAQLPPAEKRARADVVLVNDGGRDELQRRVDDLLARWGLLRPVPSAAANTKTVSL